MALGSFEIDTRPFPGGREPARTGATRSQATASCAERGGRLCTELEWERACKGPDSLSFATGEAFDPACVERPDACISGFGSLGMGSRREWTASELEGHAIVRGANPSAPPHEHRCAHRGTSDALERRPEITFRCCYGPPNALTIAPPVLGTTFTKVELPVEELERLLESDAKTRRLATEVSYFKDPEASSTVLAKGPGDTKGFLLTAAPLRWNPVAGAEFLVLGARSGKATSFVVVFHVLSNGDYRLASSFIMEDEPGPIALGYNGYIRPRLHFSSCWGCPGETGKILYREPDQAVIMQP